MKVLLVQVDGKMPNLALMKISTWHKNLGNKVFLNEGCDPNYVYISCIFRKNREKALGIAKMYPKAKIWFGGSGINYNTLPNEIEHLMPDYSLYGVDYSMGFTSRGCFRNCPFCIVPEKEGKMRDNAPITEFLHPDHKKLILFDNNFLGSPKWEENLNFIIDNKIKVSFNQGLDIRLVNKQNSEMLSKALYYDWKFRNRRLHFAWDMMSLTENTILNGIETLEESGITRRRLMFFVLVGFDTTLDQDLHRIERLKELGIKPYVMPYNSKRHLMTRWVNRRYYNFIPFEKFRRGNN